MYHSQTSAHPCNLTADTVLTALNKSSSASPQASPLRRTHYDRTNGTLWHQTFAWQAHGMSCTDYVLLVLRPLFQPHIPNNTRTHARTHTIPAVQITHRGQPRWFALDSQCLDVVFDLSVPSVAASLEAVLFYITTKDNESLVGTPALWRTVRHTLRAHLHSESLPYSLTHACHSSLPGKVHRTSPVLHLHPTGLPTPFTPVYGRPKKPGTASTDHH
jgi:hypothetical protein